MFERVGELVSEYDNVVAQLSDPEVIADQRRRVEVSRRHHVLEPIVTAYRSYQSTEADLAVAREMLAGAEGARPVPPTPNPELASSQLPRRVVPPCQTPVRSGLPSAARGTSFVAADAAIVKSSETASFI